MNLMFPALPKGRPIGNMSLDQRSVSPPQFAPRLCLRSRAFAATIYDGRTLQPTLEKVTKITGIVPERCYVDLGYRGHGVTRTKVYHPRLKRGITPTIRKEMKRRNAIEAVIGHMKTEGRLDRNFLSGVEGDQINALFAGVGYNLRQILRWLRIFCAWISWNYQAQTAAS